MLKTFFRDFKTFAVQGNVIDLAVGVIVGTAFGKIVSSLVGDIIMPIIGVLMNGVDFKGLKYVFGEATITYGNFLQTVFDFLIVAISIFMFVKVINNIKKPEKKLTPAETQEKLLTEIRDLLKAKA